MNILICSVGRRVKLIQYFKEELNKIGGKVVAVDCNPTSPAFYHADINEVVPPITSPNYISHLLKLCKKYQIKCVLSLIDPELSLLARYKQEFKENEIQVIVSDKEVIDVCYDKYLTYKFLQKNNLASLHTYIDPEQVLHDLKENKIKFPLIIKPKYGSASIGIHKVNSVNELKLYIEEKGGYVIQPFIEGEEFGVDCYIDLLTKETTNIFIKRKINMRAGETDKSISVKEPILKELIQKLINSLGPIGPIDIDCFKTIDGFIISEINPRFGGGYLHAHESGQNFVKNIITNMIGEPNESSGSNYKEGTTLVKYDDFVIL